MGSGAADHLHAGRGADAGARTRGSVPHPVRGVRGGEGPNQGTLHPTLLDYLNMMIKRVLLYIWCLNVVHSPFTPLIPVGPC